MGDLVCGLSLCRSIQYRFDEEYHSLYDEYQMVKYEINNLLQFKGSLKAIGIKVIRYSTYVVIGLQVNLHQIKNRQSNILPFCKTGLQLLVAICKNKIHEISFKNVEFIVKNLLKLLLVWVLIKNKVRRAVSLD